MATEWQGKGRAGRSRIREIPTEVVLSTRDGMPRDCAVNLDHVQTVSRGKIGPLITTLTRTRMAELREALLFALGFDLEAR